jgi:hypothetical protein
MNLEDATVKAKPMDGVVSLSMLHKTGTSDALKDAISTCAHLVAEFQRRKKHAKKVNLLSTRYMVTPHIIQGDMTMFCATPVGKRSRIILLTGNANAQIMNPQRISAKSVVNVNLKKNRKFRKANSLFP